MNYLKKILRYAYPYKIYGLLNIIANILYALFSALSFIALIPMLDVLFEAETIKITQKPTYQGISQITDYGKDYLNFIITDIAGTDSTKALLIVIALVITLFLLKNIFNYLAMYFITFLRNGVLQDIRNDLYDKTINLPLSFFSEKRKGDIMARIGTDVLEIQHSFLSILELLFREPLTIIFTIIFMLTISVKLTIFVFIFIPVSGFLISLIGKSLKKKSDRVQQEQGYFLSLIEETLTGLRIIKGFNAEGLFNQNFRASTNRFRNYSNNLLNRTNLASPTSEFLGILVIGILLYYGGIMVLKEGSLDGSSFIAYMGLAYNILTPAKAISKASYNIKKGNAAAERVLEIIEMKNPLKDDKNATSINGFEKEVNFSNIWFKYEKDYVLKDFSMILAKGESVALVGQSGSGKSTLANLITRFYDIDKGTITIDGTDIRKVTKKSLRAQIGIVTQDAILFNDSVRNNVLLGNPDATEEEIIQALKVANAYEFVSQLPRGIDTNIGDAGNKLSGGQKQRLSIARAVLKNPPILVLDEATSALDTESEKLVQTALEKVMHNRTSLVIAHRLSTIQSADKIIVMHQGQIVEQGKHDKLMAKRGTYYKLVSMQSFTTEE
ncbi:MAG: antibiotic ABC transporter ATP-binding protein [Flavobacteriales bacterium]|nr:MAG: antibiotic ABC transporter ATP-binding protein [Flavobacteriales bacterium]